MTKKCAKDETVKVVQAALDGKDGRNKGGAGLGKHLCQYCKQTGHRWTLGGILSCPQAIADRDSQRKEEAAREMAKTIRQKQAEQREVARRREECNDG